jgi:hypothetical protein
MNRRMFIVRRPRWGAAVALVVLGLLISATDAVACWDICVSTYGSIRKIDEDTFWELRSCAQRPNAAGGLTTTCHYRVYAF